MEATNTVGFGGVTTYGTPTEIDSFYQLLILVGVAVFILLIFITIYVIVINDTVELNDRRPQG